HGTFLSRLGGLRCDLLRNPVPLRLRRRRQLASVIALRFVLRVRHRCTAASLDTVPLLTATTMASRVSKLCDCAMEKPQKDKEETLWFQRFLFIFFVSFSGCLLRWISYEYCNKVRRFIMPRGSGL